jgi:hypothetical protein
VNLTIINVALGLTGIAVLASLSAIMIRRGFYRQFPLFFLYVCFAAAASIVTTAATVKADSKTLLMVAWIANGTYGLTGLIAMFESFRKVLEIYSPSRRWFLLLPLVTIVAIVSISALALRKHTPVQTTAVGLLYLSFALTADYMMAGFFGLFVVLVFIWQARWQRYPFGIMKGFGLFSIVGMFADLLRSQFGASWDFFFSYAPAVAYILGCLIWLGAFLGPEERKSTSGPGSAVDLDEISQLLGKLTKVIK